MPSTKVGNVQIGIIGGTGIYNLGLLDDIKEISIYTPFGAPSDVITQGLCEGRRIAFIPRHGRGHTIPPHKINSRANIWAMKELGVSRILAPSVVGSLREGIAPGDFVIPDQFIDQTKWRKDTFYNGGKVCHISSADPFCPELRKIASVTTKQLNLKVHDKGVYICIEGPRFSTRAESRVFREWGADIIGMTLLPECILAREVEICYVNLATVTDYDVWAKKPVTAIDIREVINKNTEKMKYLLKYLITKIPLDRHCTCENALDEAIL